MSRIDYNIALDFNDVLIVPQSSDFSSRNDVDLVINKTTLHSNQLISGVPIISANMTSVSSIRMAGTLANHDMFCGLHKFFSVEEHMAFLNHAPSHVVDHTFLTFGLNDEKYLMALEETIKSKTKVLINLDVANGYMKTFVDYVSRVRKTFPDVIIMAGNIVTPDGAKALLNAGADIIKVGIGSGAVCQSRIVAGVGVPQLSAILDTVDVVDNMGGLLCSDGGIINPGDFSKAFIAGADFVMAGSIFAGHDECNLPVIESDGEQYVEYYGMSSEHAMNLHNGGMAGYRSSEGKLVKLKYKGSVEKTIKHILGGIRSTGSYINADLKDFSLYGKLRRVHTTHNKVYGE